MSLANLVERFRQEVDDAELPGSGDDSDSLWKLNEIIEYADLAQKEFSRVARLFRDSSTTSVTRLELDPGAEYVDISPRIVKIVRSKLSTTNRPLGLKEFHEMDSGEHISNNYGLSSMLDWETTTGTPCVLVTDMDQDKVRVVPIPTELHSLTNNALLDGAAVTSVVTAETIPTDTDATGRIVLTLASGATTTIAYTSYTGSTFTIASTDFSADNCAAAASILVSRNEAALLTVDRLPLTDLTALSSTLEVTDIEHQRAMLDYMRHLAYLKQDADTYDKDLSDRFLDEFGRRAATIRRERLNTRTRVGTVRYGGL